MELNEALILAGGQQGLALVQRLADIEVRFNELYDYLKIERSTKGIPNSKLQPIADTPVIPQAPPFTEKPIAG